MRYFVWVQAVMGSKTFFLLTDKIGEEQKGREETNFRVNLICTNSKTSYNSASASYVFKRSEYTFDNLHLSSSYITQLPNTHFKTQRVPHAPHLTLSSDF